MNDIINKLIEFRENKGWSREDLAERLKEAKTYDSFI